MTDAEPRTPRFVPLSTYRLQVHAGFPLTAARDIVPYLAAPGRRRLLHVAVLHRGARQHARLRRLRTTTRSTRSSAAPRRTRRSRRRSPPHGLRPHRRLRAESHGHRHRRRTRGGTTCSRTARARRRPHFFDIDWIRPRPGAAGASCCCRSSAISTATCSNAASCRGVPRRPADAEVLRPRAADQPAAGAARLQAGAEPLAEILGADNPALHEFQSIITSLQKLPPYTERRPELMAERQREKDVARARLARLVAETPVVASRSKRRCAASTASRAGRRASTRCTSCSSRSPTGWPTGAPRRTKSTTGASSTSTRSPGCGSRSRRSSPRRTSCSRRCSATARVDARAHRSSRRAVRSGALLRDAAGSRGAGLGSRARRRRRRSAPAALRRGREDPVGPGARCRARWAVHGTTGYNFLNDLNGLFVERRARRGACAAPTPS